MRNTFDFSPLFRSSVGFDRLQRQLDSALKFSQANDSYPPYNIEKAGEDAYRISIAVAGFAEDDLDITVNEGVVTVTGQAKQEDEATYLYRGIAARAFERRFHLADHVKVNGAQLVNGLLQIDLVREIPEELKPRKIAIQPVKQAHKALDRKEAA